MDDINENEPKWVQYMKAAVKTLQQLEDCDCADQHILLQRKVKLLVSMVNQFRKEESDKMSTDAGTQTDQFSTSLGFWVEDVENMKREINQIKTLLVKFEHILVENQSKQLSFLKLYFDRQTDQLTACQEAFQANVNRDEELRTTMMESADPWSGC